MATIPQTNFRSISLPSRLDQVNSKNLDLQLENLKNCSSSSSSESIQYGILGLAELYNSITEKSAAHESMEESLSQSVDLLDACTAIRELLQTMRENVHSLQSALRRKGTDSAVQSDVASYFSSRKRMQKTLAKTLKALKKSEAKTRSTNAHDDDGLVFRQLAGAAISVFKKAAEFLSAAPSGWSLVSKVVKGGKESNEVEKMDLALSFLQGKTRGDGIRVLDAQRSLQIVDDLIEAFEGGFERLFRQLVRTRVTLLYSYRSLILLDNVFIHLSMLRCITVIYYG